MRWLPTLAMMLVSLISYIDRNTLALLAPTILKETGLSGEQYGFIISAFSLAYMIGNPVWGTILDRFGLRKGMTTAVSFWSFASLAHAFAGGFLSFGAARALLGFGEGATFPGGMRTAVQTLPPEQRSRGIAISYSGGALGAIITPLIVTPIAAWFGWRGAFWFTGFIGFAWVLIWAALSRNITHVSSPMPIKGSIGVFRDPRVWAFMGAYAFGGLPLAFVIYGSAIYLNKALAVSQLTIGKLLWIPPLGWEIGYFAWGWIADRFSTRYATLLAISAVLSLPLALVVTHTSVALVMAQLFFAMFIAAGFVIVSIAYAARVLPVEQSGLLAGLGAGSWSALVAVVMPWFGRMFDQQRYAEAFGLAAILPAVGFGAWWILSSRRAKTY